MFPDFEALRKEAADGVLTQAQEVMTEEVFPRLETAALRAGIPTPPMHNPAPGAVQFVKHYIAREPVVVNTRSHSAQLLHFMEDLVHRFTGLGPGAAVVSRIIPIENPWL